MTNARELLETLKRREAEVPDPPQELADGVWRAIRARVAAGEPVPELDPGALVGGASKSGAVVLKLLGGSTLVALVVLGLGPLAKRTPSDAPSVEAPAVETISVEAPVAMPNGPTTVQAPPIEPVVSPAAPTPAPVPPARASKRPALDPPTSKVGRSPGRPRPRTPDPERSTSKTLADEIALAGRISSALKQEAWKRTLSLVAEHERDFPDGHLVEEREAAKARASCHVGNGEAGRKEASAFAKRWPTSIHLAVVRRDCEGI